MVTGVTGAQKAEGALDDLVVVRVLPLSVLGATLLFPYGWWLPVCLLSSVLVEGSRVYDLPRRLESWRPLDLLSPDLLMAGKATPLTPA